MRAWGQYVLNTKGKSPTPGVTEAILHVKKRGGAMDFGCGSMSDTDVIFKAGFQSIDAVDIEDSIAAIVKEKRSDGMPVTFHNVPFHEFDFPHNAYDFFNAQNAIPFIGPAHVADVMAKIALSMRYDGILSVTFFGPEDGWANDPEVVIHDRMDIESYFSSGWRVIDFSEEKAERPTASGKMKKWHVFQVIASRIDIM